MATDSPGNPKTIKKQDKKNAKNCFFDIAIGSLAITWINLFQKTILNIDFVRPISFLLVRLKVCMRGDYLKAASAIVGDPNILINVVSKRVKQLKAGAKPLTDSLEKLDMEDVALKEIIEGKIAFEIPYETYQIF
ncbi:MAG: DNA-directed RNA polymerase subunit omega [Puniceicoccales bacterium]|jgi:DNA-directed RNA polymerase subunit omega|nr:DNA-directed RNA polymerase subunit omega [Puniceicoccales bacterium]